MKKYKKKVYCFKSFYLYGTTIKVYILKSDDEKFWNLHIVDPNFEDSEQNTLDRQIPIESGYNDDDIVEAVMQHICWMVMLNEYGDEYTVKVIKKE